MNWTRKRVVIIAGLAVLMVCGAAFELMRTPTPTGLTLSLTRLATNSAGIVTATVVVSNASSGKLLYAVLDPSDDPTRHLDWRFSERVSAIEAAKSVATAAALGLRPGQAVTLSFQLREQRPRTLTAVFCEDYAKSWFGRAQMYLQGAPINQVILDIPR